MRSRHVSAVVHRLPADVYAFAADPAHLPLWAAGLVRSSLTRDDDDWYAQTSDGRVTIRFAPRNDLGVLDHVVTLPSGVATHNPFRVLAHPEGAELLFTIRQLDLSDDELDRDAALVEADLLRLKALLER